MKAARHFWHETFFGNLPRSALAIGLWLFVSLDLGAQFSVFEPLKISVQPSMQTVVVGHEAQVAFLLLNVANRPVSARTPLTIDVRVISKSATNDGSVLAVQASNVFRFTPAEPGIIEVRAHNNELMPGSALVRVVSVKAQGGLEERTASTPPAAPGTSLLPPSHRRPPGRAASTAPVEAMGLILRAEDRKCLADGEDAIGILAFLDDTVSEAPTDIEITLYANGGRPMPLPPLTIAKGSAFAEAKLSSHEPGIITVDYIRANPPLTIRSDRSLKVRFSPPIVGLGVSASPPSISLIETADLVITLIDRDGHPIPSDEVSRIDLAIRSGDGVFASNVVCIGKAFPSTHALFYPTRRGPVTIAASIANLPSQSVTLNVTIPVILLSVSMAGGFLGGLLAATVSRKRRAQKHAWLARSLVGGAAGLVFAYSGWIGLISHLPPVLAHNFIGAFVVSTMGGWLGTEVFNPIARHFKIFS